MEDEKDNEPQPEEHFITIRDAARMLGVSERSVYGYMEEGSLPAFRGKSITVLRREDVLNYRHRAPGRVRLHTPTWHLPPINNPASLTVITVRIRPGQNESLMCRLAEIHQGHRHELPGTVARYVTRNPDRDEAQIVLLWRYAVMPPEAERQAALAAFFAELEGILDWNAASFAESVVLIHA